MRSLITGGTGFIGKAIARELQRDGTEVVVFDRSFTQEPKTTLRFGSILDQHELGAATQDIDEIYHLAGVLGTTELSENPEFAIDANIRGTLYALQAAHANGVQRFFFPTKPNEWLNMYSITKTAGESICRFYQKYHAIDIRILRWLNAYGPGQKIAQIRKAVPLFILQALYGLPLEIWGDGSQPIDLIYVDDLAYVTVAFTRSERKFDHTLDTGLCHSITVREAAELIVELVGSTSKLMHLPMRIGEDAGVRWRPLETAWNKLQLSRQAITLKEGLLETIAYYRSLEDRYKEHALRFYYGSQDLRNSPMTLAGRRLRSELKD